MAGIYHNELFLGHCSIHGEPFYISQEHRRRHIYGIGSTGAGKTTFLQSLVLQDIYAGRGLCLIDPHGDMAEFLASCIPRSRLNDVIYFDAADREYPIGLNPMSGWADADMRELVSSQLVSMFYGLWHRSWGERLEFLFKNTIMALMDDPRAAVSLVAVQRMLSDTEYRERILKRVSDPVVLLFWHDYFGQYSTKEQRDRVSSTFNKSGKLVLSPVLRNIVGQVRSGFDLSEVMDKEKILIVNLAKGKIGGDNANFLGSLIVAEIVGRAMQRARQQEEERTDFHLYIDEFQNFTTTTFADIVSEARKYRLNLAVAHQNFDQIDSNVLSAILKNAGTLAAFSVNFEDAEKLAPSFHPFQADTLSGSGVGQFMCKSGQEIKHLKTPHPRHMQEQHCDSLDRVRKNSRMRYARRRKVVEQDFARWISR